MVGIDIFITAKIPASQLIAQLQREGFKIEVWDGELPIPYEILIEKVKCTKVLISLLHDRVDRKVIDAGEQLKAIINYAVGYDNIDVEYALSKGIKVAHTPDVLSDATAELAWALLFAVSRKIVQADQFVREGKFRSWDPYLFLGKEIAGSCIGVIGVGRIGKKFIRKGSGFDIKWLYYSRRRKPDIENLYKAEYTPIKEMFKLCDFISIHVPLNSETYHLIDEACFEKANPELILINTSRGKVIDEKALIKALKTGKIAGAGLDVFENEPHVPSELIELPNVVLTPHIGSATYKARRKMAQIVLEEALRVLKGEELKYPVKDE